MGFKDQGMQHVVSLSGGLSSAVAADRVIERFGSESVTLWFADVLWEDEDLKRFLGDLEQRWQMTILRASEGRTPLQVASDKQIIPNSQIAPCSEILKINLFKARLATWPKPLTVYLGMDWHEENRMEAPRRNYEAIDGVTVDYPLLWRPLETRSHADTMREWDIEIPRLYAMGFPHNNCGGRCVRQGAGEWRRLLYYFPERYAEVEQWEAEQRAKGGPRENRTILRTRVGGESQPITLTELRKNAEGKALVQPTLIEDQFGCYCSY